MARELPLSNGHLFVSFDHSAFIREITFPLVGKENHVGGRQCRMGLSVGSQFAWFQPDHILSRGYEGRAPIVETRLEIPDFPFFRLHLTDWVDISDNILFRHLRIENESSEPAEAVLYLHYDMDISHSDIGNTASFLPDHQAMLHYKDDIYFLMATLDGDNPSLDQFACGARHGHREGTWKDAEDTRLEGNPIAQGAVDSVYSTRITVPPGGCAERTSLLIAASSYVGATDLLAKTLKMSVQESLSRCRSFFDFWVETPSARSDRLPSPYRQLFIHSLFVLRHHMGANGSIIAAVDSDSLSLSRDTYSYLWPRDGAIIAHALDRAGFGDLTRRFYQLLPGLLSREGFLLHKYHPSLSPGSSWHPAGIPGSPPYPIQEDETALCIWALERHLDLYRDMDSLLPLYGSFVLPAANFLESFRDEKSGLPLPSYDLWEERAGIWTYTAATVWAGLDAAAKMATRFGDISAAHRFSKTKTEIGEAIRHHLFDPETGTFLRGLLLTKAGSFIPDSVPDSSLSALYWLGLFSPQDPLMAPAMERLFEGLHPGETGGIIRYRDDPYYRDDPSHPGNPWIISTLWKVRWLARTTPDPLYSGQIRNLLDWVVERAGKTGMLAEQYHPRTMAPLSASPLTWSHAEWVLAMIELYEAAQERHPWDDLP